MQSRLNKLVSVGTCESHIKCKVFVHNCSQIFLFLQPIFILSNLLINSKLQLKLNLQNRQKEGTEKNDVTIVNRNKITIVHKYQINLALLTVLMYAKFTITSTILWVSLNSPQKLVKLSIICSDFKTELRKRENLTLSQREVHKSATSFLTFYNSNNRK